MKQLTPKGYALFLLKLRDRSVGEIVKKMREKGFSEEDTEEAVSFLLDKSFLDDERFARNLIRQRMMMKPEGKYLLRQKLKAKFISDAIIEMTLSEIGDDSERDSAREVGKKWLLSHQRVSKEDRWKKLGAFLMRRGYDYEKVKSILDEIVNTEN